MKISVIIPTYNRETLLQRAIESVLHQTHKANEIIVINDGKPLSAPPRARLIETKGSIGPTKARKIACSETICDAICYLDDDDELLPNHLALLSAKLEKGYPFAFSKAIYRYPDHDTEDPEPNNQGVKEYYNPEALLRQNIAPISSFMHTRAAYEKIGGWDDSLIRMEDWDFWGRLFIQFGPPAFVDQATNVIYKGLGDNRTDSNQFVYAMSCHWRDVVADRLSYLSKQKRGRIYPEDLKHIPAVPKIGVVMPVYNAEKYLASSLDSILGQTYQDFEIIAVDDCSTDSSASIIYSYAQKDKRIRGFQNASNLGVTKTLNYGILLSRSEYVARMDADDISEPKRFEKQIEFLDKHKDIYVLGTCFHSMSQNMDRIIWTNHVEQDPVEIEKVLKTRCCVGHPTVMMRRRLFESLGGYSEKPEHHTVEDYEMWLRTSRTYKIANLPDFLLKHRVHEAQVSKRLNETQKENTEKLKREYR